MTLPPFLVHVGLLSKHRPVGHLFAIDPDMFHTFRRV